jgi:drug/metabolite transporter (DMT)-like permease
MTRSYGIWLSYDSNHFSRRAPLAQLGVSMLISRRPELALLITVLIWGLNFPIIKIALEPMSPFVVNALRFAVSVVVLGVMHARSGSDFWLPLRQSPGRIVLLGLLGYVAYQLCFIVGIDLTTAGSASLIMASAPAWTALGSRMMGLERLPLGAWGGLAIGLVGTVVVVVGGQGAVDLSIDALNGNLLMLLGAVLWAAYTVLSRPMMDSGISATGLAFFGMVISLPVLWGLGAWGASAVEWSAVSWQAWAAVLFSGGLSTGAAYAWWNVAVREIGPSRTSMSGNLVPVIALVFGALLLGEAIRLPQILGGALTIAGLVMMRRARTRRHVPSGGGT